jgi:hypothetical protein
MSEHENTKNDNVVTSSCGCKCWYCASVESVSPRQVVRLNFTPYQTVGSRDSSVRIVTRKLELY